MAAALALGTASPGVAAGRRDNNFDAIRLAAALSVVFSHSFLVAEGTEAREPFVRLTGNQCVLGLVGVFVFFVISGYLVTESYCRRPKIVGFLRRRALRIFPGLAVNVMICAVILGPVVTTLPLGAYFADPRFAGFVIDGLTLDPVAPALPGVVFVDNPVGLIVNGSMWTLRYEVMMYVMIVLLGVAGLLRLGSAVALTGLGIAAIYFQTALKPLGDLAGWSWLLGFFASGMCVYFLRERLAFTGRWALVALAALILFGWLHRFIMLFPLAGAYLVIYAARRYDPAIDYARKYGDLSYGIYIYGWPAEAFVAYASNGRATWWQVLGGGLAISVPLAWLSWHLIEKHALRAGRSRLRPLAAALPTAE